MSPMRRMIRGIFVSVSLTLVAIALVGGPATAGPEDAAQPKSKTSAKAVTKKVAKGKNTVVRKATTATAPSKPSNSVAKDPYLGAIVIDAADGRVLFEEGADLAGYPASMLKIMDLLVLLEKVQAKSLSLSDKVDITAESSKIGGSQVYLKEKEVFTVEELLYAMMIQSANDAAVALAIKTAGTKDAFVDLMNKRAGELGMKSTKFHSVHGLPPGKGQELDVTTARDMALLCRELVKRPEALKYTSTKERPFRPEAKEPFIMRTHNTLLLDFEGCDGLKTGYIRVAGYSICATAKRGDKRYVVVVLGSTVKKTCHGKAKELLSKAFAGTLGAAAAPKPAVPPATGAGVKAPATTPAK
jgi:D-alanyl-D-alanine carboxypeptidase (penicillin-binding protein 5/6)